MTEQQYIDLTDLAKLRMVLTSMRAITPEISTVIDEGVYNGMTGTMYQWVQELEKRVIRCDG